MQGRSRLPFVKEATEEEENLPSPFSVLLKCSYKCSLKSPLGTFFSGYLIRKEPEPFRFAVRSSAAEIPRVQVRSWVPAVEQSRAAGWLGTGPHDSWLGGVLPQVGSHILVEVVSWDQASLEPDKLAVC